MTEEFAPVFGIYEKALPPQPWESMFADATAAGYRNFEMSVDISERRLERLCWSDATCAAVAAAAKDAGIRLFSLCLSAHRRFSMGSADPCVRARSLEIFRAAIRLCGELGIPVIQVAGYDVFYEPHTPDTEKRYVENLHIGTRWAAEAGVMLAIEPVEVFVTSVAKAMELVSAVGSPWLNVYPDIANMAGLGIDPIPQLALGAGHTVAVHVREAQPDFFENVLPFGSGIVDFAGCFRQLYHTGFSGPFTIEMWNEADPNYKTTIADARAFVERKLLSAWQAVQTKKD